VDGSIEQRADDGLVDCPGRIVAHGAAMINGIHRAHGNFGLGGFRRFSHNFLHWEDFFRAFLEGFKAILPQNEFKASAPARR
jgi:hypothetical protein